MGKGGQGCTKEPVWDGEVALSTAGPTMTLRRGVSLSWTCMGAHSWVCTAGGPWIYGVVHGTTPNFSALVFSTSSLVQTLKGRTGRVGWGWGCNVNCSSKP